MTKADQQELGKTIAGLYVLLDSCFRDCARNPPPLVTFSLLP